MSDPAVLLQSLCRIADASDNMSVALEKIRKFRKQVLVDLYNQCTEPQQALFNRMYGSIDKIPEEKINWAIQQCERTIANMTEHIKL